MPQSYTRDLAITGVICFCGGIGLTLLAVLIYNRVSRRKQQKKSRAQKEKDEGPTAAMGNHVGHTDVNERRRNFLPQPRRNPANDGEAVISDTGLGDNTRSNVVEDDDYSRYQDYNARGQWSNHMRGSNGVNRRMENEVDLENGRSNRPHHPHGISTLYTRRDLPKDRAEDTHAHKADRNMYYRGKSEGGSHGQEMSHPESFQRANKAPEPTMRSGFDGIPQHHRVSDRDWKDYHKRLEKMKNQDVRRESRNVTFDLESFNLEQEHVREKKVKSRDKEKERKKKQLRVKLNLSPVRKSKVHPKKKNDQSKGSKKRKDKKQDEKEKDKESKKKDEEEGKGDASASQPENIDPGTSQPAYLTHNPNPANLAFANGRGQIMLPGRMPYQLRNANQPGTRFSMLGSADPRLSGYRLPLPGSNALLNTTAAPGLFPGTPSVAPGTAVTAPTLALTAGHTSFSRPPGVGLAPGVTSAAQLDPLSSRGLHSHGGEPSMNPAANTVNNPTVPQPQGQAASEGAPALAHHSALGPGPQVVEGTSQRPPELQLPQIKENLPLQTQQAPPVLEGSPGVPPQTLGSEPRVEVTSKAETVNAPGDSTVNENKPQTEAAAVAASSNSTEAGNVFAPAPAAAPVASLQSEPSAGGAVGATAAPPLLQQEYISEEGGASPRRKLRLVLPEKVSNRPPTALEKKIR